MYGCALLVYPFTHWQILVLLLYSYWRLNVAFIYMYYIYGNVPCEKLIIGCILKIITNSLKIAITNPYVLIEITYYMRNNSIFQNKKYSFRRGTVFYTFVNLFVVLLNGRLLDSHICFCSQGAGISQVTCHLKPTLHTLERTREEK